MKRCPQRHYSLMRGLRAQSGKIQKKNRVNAMI
jgi:hypothetical protein